MKISFGLLQIKDFKAIKSLEVDFSKFAPGCHAVRGVNNLFPRLGSNGASKSSIFDAVTFALYGRTTHGGRSAIVVPRDNVKANPQIDFAITVDGTEHTIRRKAAPHSLKVDGKTVEQKFLDDLLRIPFKVLVHAVILPQDESLFFDLSPAEKLSLISDIHNLDRFDNYSDIAATGLRKAVDAGVELSGVAQAIAGRIGILAESIKTHERLMKRFEDDKATELAALTKDRNVKEQRYSTYDGIAKECLAQIDGLTGEINKAELELKHVYHALDTAREVHAKLYGDKQILGVLKSGVARCLRCGQNIDEKHRRVEVAAIEKRVAAAPQLAPLEAKQTLYGQAIQQKRDRIHIHRTKMADASKAMAVAKSEIAAIDNRIERLTTQENPYGSQWTGSRKRMMREKADLKTANDALAANAKLQHRYLLWRQAFKEIKLMVIDNLMQTLSVLTTAYASSIGLDAEVIFGVERETQSGTKVTGINAMVNSVGRGERSGGEWQRLRLATSLALGTILLADAGIDLPIRVLDEPSSGLSPEGLKELAAFLVEYGEREKLAVFIVDQRPVSGVTSTVTVTRSQNGVELS